MGKKKNMFFDRNPKAIIKEAQRSKILRRKLEKREFWLQCSCKHSSEMLTLISKDKIKDNVKGQVYRCACGKIIPMEYISYEKSRNAFETVDRICDLLKMVPSGKNKDSDKEILNMISSLQFHLAKTEQLWNDYVVAKKNAAQNRSERYNREIMNIGSFDARPSSNNDY